MLKMGIGAFQRMCVLVEDALLAGIGEKLKTGRTVEAHFHGREYWYYQT
jgi:hypothetical protein